MSAAISACTPAERSALLGELDEEFVFRKGRTRSLAERFPRLFATDNLARVLVARDGGRVVAAAAAQPFTFVDGDVRWRCASVGAVWTHPSFRGRGLASAVMRALAERNAADRVDALVLWTSLHGFYGSFGWRLDDSGLFGIPAVQEPAPAMELTPPRAVRDCDLEALERIRRAHLPRRVERTAADWLVLPIPATSVSAFVSEGAYALVGALEGTGYVYELVGDEAGFAGLWASIRARHARLFVNESQGKTADWLAQRGGVRFEPQRLAMWMPLSSAAEALAGRLFVPYLDRI